MIEAAARHRGRIIERRDIVFPCDARRDTTGHRDRRSTINYVMIMERGKNDIRGWASRATGTMLLYRYPYMFYPGHVSAGHEIRSIVIVYGRFSFNLTMRALAGEKKKKKKTTTAMVVINKIQKVFNNDRIYDKRTKEATSSSGEGGRRRRGGMRHRQRLTDVKRNTIPLSVGERGGETTAGNWICIELTE